MDQARDYGMSIDTGKAQVSDEAITKGSGRSWQEWVDLLDAWGGRDKSHTDIARYVVSLGIDGWWAQGVTVGYERLTGRREVGQRGDGLYSGSASKTLAVDLDVLEAAWVSDDARRQWLDPDILTLRTHSGGKSARFDQADGGILAVYFTAKGPGKSSLQVQEEKLPSKEAADAFRASWKTRLAALDRHLTSVRTE
jgi:hypothetical protein